MIPDQPTAGIRTYAGCRIESITPLGLMVLTMSEKVALQDEYKDLTLQDFDVVYLKNSDENDQQFSFQIIEISDL